MIKGSLSMFRENVSMSVSNVLHNKMRSFLTILGIIIGVMAVIAMITTVSGVTDEITSQFSAMGSDKFNVTVRGTALRPGLTEAQVETLGKLENVSGISISTSSTVPAKHGDSWVEDVMMDGRNAVYFRSNPAMLRRGRLPDSLDEAQENRVCVISPDLAQSLFFGEDPLYQEIILGGHTFRVIGVLSDDASADLFSQAMGIGTDKRVIIPYTTALRLSGNVYISSLEVYVEDTERISDTIDDFKTELDGMFNNHDNTYTIINMASLMDSMSMVTGMMTTLLAGIAGISLLVGGIGIMNMMLVSVTERTTEIGLRKALGAEAGAIQMQFLIEAFILSVLGGIFGAISGVALSVLLADMIGTAFHINWGAIALGVGFSALVGLVFGWAPARKASALNPIDALRAV